MEKRVLMRGDVLAVTRPMGEQHFAVYVGDNKVIHFAAPNGDFEGVAVIHEAPFENFLREQREFSVLEFSETRRTPRRYSAISPWTGTLMNQVILSIGRLGDMYKDFKYHIYSQEETAQRAEKVAKDYKDAFIKHSLMSGMNHAPVNLIFNNCEHFAIWCKTGIKETRQVSRILNNATEPLLAATN